jgi:hypothetical protein
MIGLKPETARRLIDLLNDETSNGTPRRINNSGRITEVVLVETWDFDYLIGTGKVQGLVAGTGAWDDLGEGTVNIVTMNGGDLVEGHRYPAYRYGLVDGVPTFAIQDADYDLVCVEHIIPSSLMCYDGDIIFETEWIAVPKVCETEEGCNSPGYACGGE